MVWRENSQMPRAEAVVDLGAIAANVRTLRAATASQLMAVVKADGYGHGLLPSAQAAIAGGADWLGVATLDEALQLRAGGIDVPTLAWLWTPSETGALRQAIAAGVDVSVNSEWALRAVLATGLPARVHIKVDTGLSRNGVYVTEQPAVFEAAARAQQNGQIDVVAIWTHFAYADAPGHATIDRQIDNFHTAVELARQYGITPEIRHIANSAATLTRPDTHLELVRPGVAIYGLSPVPGEYGLTPAMTLRAELASVKRVVAGEGVSYGHVYTTDRETTLALVPLGYADGVPRAATNVGPVRIGGQSFRVSGRICMDQFVVDVRDTQVKPGDSVVLFGVDGPHVQEWADAVDTIHYEIVTRVGSRVPRTYINLPSGVPHG